MSSLTTLATRDANECTETPNCRCGQTCELPGRVCAHVRPNFDVQIAGVATCNANTVNAPTLSNCQTLTQALKIVGTNNGKYPLPRTHASTSFQRAHSSMQASARPSSSIPVTLSCSSSATVASSGTTSTNRRRSSTVGMISSVLPYICGPLLLRADDDKQANTETTLYTVCLGQSSNNKGGSCLSVTDDWQLSYVFPTIRISDLSN